ncbi:1-phosphofructokinase [Cellulosilyticum lentocellum]|uniref:Tagatose-6-phosphate kinase n=1 Tax=Cellulosilyticum lentocellum (strain ATCC 49066 / DSM 5427 / NCIMB 11756 / RHM5) TaxID=642492 RepID=F2JIQ3_CELLD|nr:1-phosphofructokinase [Cellulosilyticum lentocellum]ADZ85523.1 1-phosphofructokinase [Cellulosilyticum lentocellum DSM 5427]
MIYTVTLNPSLDYVMHLDQMNAHCVNRSNKEEIYPGGKGINVSIVLNNLRIPNKALGFIAGFTGKEIENVMKQLGGDTDFILLDRGISRINVKLEADKETEINGMGPQITPSDLKDLYIKLEQIEEGDFLVLAGSIPKSVPDSIYKDIMKMLANKNINVVVDATKDLLLNVLQYKPFLIKPNHIELAEMFNVTLNSDDDIVTYARKLQEMGAQNVLISMGGDGSILITNEGEVVKISVPEGTVINTVGSGDSMVAGFIAGYLKTKDLKQALKFATATGSATAFSTWLATSDKIDDLLSKL